MKFILAVAMAVYVSGCATSAARSIASNSSPIVIVSKNVEVPLPSAVARTDDLIIEAASEIPDEWIDQDQAMLSQLPIHWYRIDPAKCELASDGRALRIPKSEFPSGKNSAVRVRTP
jgi:hypothetical protein